MAAKAQRIGEEYTRLFGIRTVMLFLTDCGLEPSTAIKVWKRWGPPSVELIRDNPYILCCDEIGLDFEEVDEQMSERFQIPWESYKRLSAGVRYILRHNSRQGHTCLPRSTLEDFSAQYLKISKEKVQDTLAEMEENSDLVAYEAGGRSWLYLPELYGCLPSLR